MYNCYTWKTSHLAGLWTAQYATARWTEVVLDQWWKDNFKDNWWGTQKVILPYSCSSQRTAQTPSQFCRRPPSSSIQSSASTASPSRWSCTPKTWATAPAARTPVTDEGSRLDWTGLVLTELGLRLRHVFFLSFFFRWHGLYESCCSWELRKSFFPYLCNWPLFTTAKTFFVLELHATMKPNQPPEHFPILFLYR